MIDKKARDILFSRYWLPSEGWQENPVSEEDFAYAKSRGMMFDDAVICHDEAIEQCLQIRQKIDRKRVVEAFVSSLETRDFAQRSAISSFASILHLPDHSYDKISNNPDTAGPCRLCGESLGRDLRDISVLNFERHKFGGVRHCKPSYASCDLGWFLSEEASPLPSPTAIRILHSILDSLNQVIGNRLSDAPASLKGLFKANKNEREGVVSALGYCGVLSIPNYDPIHLSYVPYAERDVSSYSKSDWPFPADLWRPEFGINHDAVDFWFGDVL